MREASHRKLSAKVDPLLDPVNGCTRTQIQAAVRQKDHLAAPWVSSLPWQRYECTSEAVLMEVNEGHFDFTRV